MKWRVNLPDTQFVNLRPEPVDPDVVVASLLKVQDGVLVFEVFGSHMPNDLVRAYAPGQWTTVERVEDE